MSGEYHKIDSIYKRDERGRFLIGQWATPEIEYLKDCVWDWTEKIDGTNIRVIRSGGRWEFKGKTDSASIPAPLVEFLRQHFEKWVPPVTGDDDLTLYGEGYGWKIQKAGPRYCAEPRFILFDVRVGAWWLRREDVAEVAQKFDVPVVASMGSGAIADAVAWVRAGFASVAAIADPTLEAEGLVLRPRERLLDGGGHRIITKVKARDFN